MKFYRDKMLQASSILFILNMLASVLNYVCQLLMARVLTIESLGAINTIFSFLLIVGVPGTTLTMIVAKHYAELKKDTLPYERTGYIGKWILLISSVTIAFFLCFVIFHDVLRQVLSIDNTIILLLTFVLGALSLYQPLYSGVFSGNKRFVLVGIYSLLIPVYKIISVFVAYFFTYNDRQRLCIILVVMILGTIFTALFGHFFTKKIVGSFSLIKSVGVCVDLKLDDFNTFVLNICLMIYMNVDIFVVRHWGGDRASGYYSAVLLFGRIIYYFSTTLGTILLPLAATAKSNKKEQVVLLNKTLAFMLCFAFFCIIPLNIFGGFFLEILYGKAYLNAQHYIKYVSLISLSLSVCTILINYLVGAGKTRFATVLMVGVNVFTLIFMLIDNNVEKILSGIGICGFAGALFIYLATVFDRSKEIEKNE